LKTNPVESFKVYLFSKLVAQRKIDKEGRQVGGVYLPGFLVGKRVYLIVVDEENKQDIQDAINIRIKPNKKVLGR